MLTSWQSKINSKNRQIHRWIYNRCTKTQQISRLLIIVVWAITGQLILIESIWIVSQNLIWTQKTTITNSRILDKTQDYGSLIACKLKNILWLKILYWKEIPNKVAHNRRAEEADLKLLCQHIYVQSIEPSLKPQFCKIRW